MSISIKRSHDFADLSPVTQIMTRVTDIRVLVKRSRHKGDQDKKCYRGDHSAINLEEPRASSFM